MTHLLQQAISSDDPDRAARIIQNALGIESNVDRGALSGLVTNRRRFPPPCTVHDLELGQDCFVVGDADDHTRRCNLRQRCG